MLGAGVLGLRGRRDGAGGGAWKPPGTLQQAVAVPPRGGRAPPVFPRCGLAFRSLAPVVGTWAYLCSARGAGR